jgi:hypothetical protein
VGRAAAKDRSRVVAVAGVSNCVEAQRGVVPPRSNELRARSLLGLRGDVRDDVQVASRVGLLVACDMSTQSFRKREYVRWDAQRQKIARA